MIVLAQAAICDARAGGGGGFHGGGGGGGGHGGGGHGGGSGGGELIFDLIWLLFAHPAIGVPLLIVIIAFFYFANRFGVSTYQSGVLRSGGAIIEENRKQQIVAQLRQHDPAFDEAAFLQRVSGAFEKIQDAWCNQNLQNVQLFLSDGVAERFALQFDEQRAMGYHDQMSQIGIDDIRIADLDSSGVFDEIAVRINAHAIDFRAPLAAAGQKNSAASAQSAPPLPSPDRSVEPFSEIWSFLRRRGSLTDNSKPGLMEGHCPNCGAAIELNQFAQCQYCKALLHSGQYDWVLSEITQASEWERSTDRQIVGLDAFRQRDPSFDPQALEDRASVIFWRRASADRLGKIDPVRKVATDEFCNTIHDAVLGTSGQPRRYAGECAVGGVELLSMTAAANDAMDRAVVKVRWSGKVFTLDPQRQHIDVGDDLLRSNALVLERRSAARTDPDKSISSAHCPNCGSPESNSADNKCPNCGTVLNDGSRDWVLTQWLNMTDPSIVAILHNSGAAPGAPTAAAPTNAGALLAWAVAVAASDGRIDDRERAALNALANDGGVSSDQLQSMLNAAAANNLHPPMPTNPTEANDWLSALCRVALVDGVLDQHEWMILMQIGKQIGLGELDVKLMLKRVQGEQYAAARQARQSS